MSTYRLGHLSDREMLRGLNTLVARDRATTAELLAHIAEVDERKLYVPAGYPSMSAYCIEELRFSEEAAHKRITAARAARDFPAIFAAVADGRLHLSAVVMLAPRLTQCVADELLAAAAHKSKSELERLLAECLPRADLPTRIQVAGSSATAPTLVANQEPAECTQPAPGRVESRERSRVTPLSPGRVGLQVTVDQETHDKLRYAQALLGHRVPSGDLAQVLDLALDALVAKLEKQKFAATDRPRGGSGGGSVNPRHIPAAVKRAVWERDGAQCAFVAENGHRCGARTNLEYDHVDPVACGGEASVDTIRLLCRAHNQYMAERTFGAGFMDEKRQAARRARAAAGARNQRLASAMRADAPASAANGRSSREPSDDTDVVPWLRRLGYRADEARRAAERCARMPEASLEEKVRAALSYLCPSARTVRPSETNPARAG